MKIMNHNESSQLNSFMHMVFYIQSYCQRPKTLHMYLISQANSGIYCQNLTNLRYFFPRVIFYGW